MMEVASPPPPAPDVDRRVFALSDLLPPRTATTPLAALRPRGPVQAAVLGVLLALTLGYVAYWCYGHRAILVDLDRQNDDGRQHLFHYHAYGDDAALADDPVAQDARVYSPPVVRGVYRVLVPMTGVFAASKIVQAFTWGIVLVGAWVLLRAERGGWAAACLFLFFMLHTPELTNRTVGGLPRAFASPLAGLWLAGAIAGNERARWAAAIVAGAVYPFVMLIILGGEGFLRLSQGIDVRRRAVRANWLRYAAMVALCFAALLPYQIDKGEGGDPPTYAQAVADPAFGQQGRTKQVPFPDPWVGGLHSALRVFYAGDYGPPTFSSSFPFVESNRWAMLGLGLSAAAVLVLAVTRRTPPTAAAGALLLGTLVLSVAARVLAFRLYIPARYYEYGVPIAVIGLLVAGFGLVGWRVADAGRRRVLQWATACAVIVLTFLVAGSGVVPGNGIRLDRAEDARLYDFAGKLPVDARFLCHPYDGDDIPYWSARATVVSRENLLPWDYANWPNHVARGEAALRAMYATDPQTVLDFCAAWDCSHVLIFKARYGPRWRAYTRVFEPFDTFLDGLLRDVSVEQLVLADPPKDAVVFEDEEWLVLDVTRLRRVWGEE